MLLFGVVVFHVVALIGKFLWYQYNFFLSFQFFFFQFPYAYLLVQRKLD